MDPGPQRSRTRIQKCAQGKTSDGSSRLYTFMAVTFQARGKYPSRKHLFAMAKNNPRSCKMASWHMSEVNPSTPGALLGLNAFKTILTSAPVKGGSISDKISKASGGQKLPSVRLLNFM
ncbi:hypothetical protein EVAR_28858_1 [Eumeta japonica]|uniref:Uncharacterized protein n=1 Tax=Eumeta variegata TaxID=151549 RepID=A0A4C1YHJ9_EUMVA|nr:hypothetical protein EVAR_28858_1 [Eumeta japonica]